MPRLANPTLSTTPPELHIFDVGRTNVALSLWRTIERRNTHSSRSLSPSTISPGYSWQDPAALPGLGSYKNTSQLPVTSSGLRSDTLQITSPLLEPMSEREHYFKLSNAPTSTWKLAQNQIAEKQCPPDAYKLSHAEPEEEDSRRVSNPLLRSHAPELAELTKEWGSLSSEGRKQAEEAGLRLSSSINRLLPQAPHEGSQNKAHQDRWAAYSRIHSVPEPQEAEASVNEGPADTEEPKDARRPLLEVFEAELAKLLSDDRPLPASEVSAPISESHTHGVTSQNTPELEGIRNTDRGAPDNRLDGFSSAVRGFVDGIGLLASEVRNNLPEAHEHIAHAQQNIPQAVQQTLRGAFRGFGSQLHSIADNVQIASIATRNAADRARGMEVQGLESVVFGLRGVANGIGEFSRALFPAPNHQSVSQPSEGPSDDSAKLPTSVKNPAHEADDKSVETAKQSEPENLGAASEASNMVSPNSNVDQSEAESIQSTISSNLEINRTFETIDRISIEAEELNLRRLRKERQDAITQPRPHCFQSTARSGGREDGRINSESERGEHHGTFNSSYTPSIAPSKSEQEPYFSRACVFGCSSVSNCRHRRATGLPYPSRNEFHRGRHLRRSPPHFTSQLPYEYVVPPPGFYNGSDKHMTGSAPRHDGGRHYARSRSPSTSPRRSSPRRRMNPPPGWSQFPRHGPIHLPQSLHLGSQSRPAQVRPSKLEPPPAAWVNPRANAGPSTHGQWAKQGLSNAPNASGGPTFGDHGVDRRQNPLRHRQSWHPSSIDRSSERWNVTHPERPEVSFAEPPAPSARAETSSIPRDRAWDRAVRHRMSTGALVAHGIRDSKIADLSWPAAQHRNGATESAEVLRPAGAIRSWKYDSQCNNSDEKLADGPAAVGEKTTWRARQTNDISNPGSSSTPFGHHGAQGLSHMSPVSDAGPGKSVRTRATIGPTNRDTTTSKPSSLTSVSESLSPQPVVREMSFFPALAQLEEGASRNTLPFPPLPTMEPLIPLRTSLHVTNVHTSKGKEKASQDFDTGIPTSSSEESLAPRPDAPEANESSGEFFRRMTGLGESSNNASTVRTIAQPARPAKLKPAQFGARLAGPFDPLAETVTLHRSRLIDGVHRSATERRLIDDHYASNGGRPYSDHLTSKGRLAWDTFFANHQSAIQPSPSVASSIASSERTSPAVVPSVSPVDRSSENDMLSGREHEDASTVKVVQECVDQLQTLGFGSAENEGAGRLLVYAQAAEGDLEEAIEIIEEERKAYEQRGSR